MASELAIKMKYRKYSAEQLQAVIDSKVSSEMETNVAVELLTKLEGKGEAPKAKPAEIKITSPKPVKKVAEKSVNVVPQKGEVVYEAEHAPKKSKKSSLTPVEQERLEVAELEFDDRQSKRKGAKAVSESAPRETKRQNLAESIECPGIKVNSSVRVKGDTKVGTVDRIYISGDGKEKCMIKIGNNKPIKKRINTIELAN